MFQIRWRIILMLTSIVASLNFGCQSQPAAPVYHKDGRTYGITSGAIFRHKWWNYYERALSYAEGRYFSEATADLKDAIGQRDRDQRMARSYGMHFIDYFPHRELGVIYYETGQLEAAQRSLLRSLEHYPSAKARFYLDQVRRMLIKKSRKPVSAPQLSLDFHDSIIWTRQDPVVIRGRAVDANYVQGVTVKGRPVFLEGAKKELSFRSELTLPQGAHKISVQAVNLMGLITKRDILVHIDRQGPLVVVEKIIPITGPHGEILELHGILTDPAGIESVHINHTPLMLKPGQRIPFQYQLPHGADTLSVDAHDRLGNRTSAEMTINEKTAGSSSLLLLAASDNSSLIGLLDGRDRQAPDIRLKGWSDTQTVFMDKVYLEGVVSDNRTLADITINRKSFMATKGRLVFFSRVVPLAEGSNTIVIAAQDSAGNRKETQIVIIRRIPEAFQLNARLKVSVLPFDKQNAVAREGFAFQGYLIDALINQERFRVVERSLLDIILQEQKLSRSQLVDRGTALKVGRLAAAQSIIAGSIIESRHGIEIVSRMIDTETSDILASEDVYGELKDRRAMLALANGMALKYHREFPLSGGMVIRADGKFIFTDLGKEEIKLQRRIIVYKESPVQHPVSNQVVGTDKQILCRARINQVQKEISKASLLGEPTAAVEKFHKVVAE